MPVLTKGDLLVIRPDVSYNLDEQRMVIQLAGDNACVLYNYYRCATLYKDSERISDSHIAYGLGWPEYKVARYRRALEKAGLIRTVTANAANKTTLTKLIVGMESVALFDAGLPHNIVDLSSFRQAMNKLGIEIQDVPSRVKEITAEVARTFKNK